MILKLSNLSMSFGERTLFSEVNLSMKNGQKVIVVGSNGCGKTTLLKIVGGELEPTAGSVSFFGKTVGFVKQFRITEDRTVYAEGLSIFKKALEAYQKAMKSVEDFDFHSYEKYLQEAELLDVYAVEKKVKKMLKGVGFSDDDFKRRVSTLSAGEITRLQLAKLLIDEPDLLILDEPGNYLDIYGMIFLRNALFSVKSAVLMATHDRTLMESIPDEIWDIDFGTVKVYEGKYSDFLFQKEVYVKSLRAKERSLSKEIKHLNEVVERYKRWGREKAARQARSKEKLLDKLSQEKKQVSLKESKRFENLNFSTKRTGEDVVLRVKNLRVYAGSKYIGTFSFEVKNGEKIALLGKNGVGKTTLLQKIVERPKNVEFGPNVKLAYVDTVGIARNSRTLLSSIWEFVPNWPDYEVRRYLGRFGFEGDDAFKTLKSLSGGEFVRFEISKALLKEPNFLIMDEPTNHLDIYMIESLENNLKKYEGTLLFSTHDLEFAHHTADRYLVMESESLHSFQEYEEAIEFIQSAVNPRTVTKKSAREVGNDYEKRKELKNKLRSLEKKMKMCESLFEELDFKLEEVEEEMHMCASDHVKLGALMGEKEKIEIKMEEVLKNMETLEREKKKLEEEAKW